MPRDEDEPLLPRQLPRRRLRKPFPLRRQHYELRLRVAEISAGPLGNPRRAAEVYEGLRDGTLKQLFDEEIKKSWEEYADQVGKDVADSTPYFRDALNEILADGKQLF